MPEEAILRIEELARLEGQPPLQNSRLIVEWRPDSPFEDDDDPDYVYNGSEEDDDFNEDDYEWDEVPPSTNTIETNTELHALQTGIEYEQEEQGTDEQESVEIFNSEQEDVDMEQSLQDDDENPL